ncbi:glucosamine-6-phosphate deaminase [Porphyromonas pogonae]|uniref:glucosamine-6-phosphate deaminase n=1 Tax=Porphyromonas pogonae TaxID=867595 RepID=UPI002E7932AE|nr:glucosamine-6-phosphate deaminase [Porphyromonas pogonae]
MRTNLSSLISLTDIPEQYYRPKNAFEQTVLCRYENIPTDIYHTDIEAAATLARHIGKEIQEAQKSNKPYVLGLSGGLSPVIVYRQLVRLHEVESLSFANVIAVICYEYYPLPENSPVGCYAKIKEELLDKVDIKPENIYCPNSSCEKDMLSEVCDDFESHIDSLGGIDHLILGIGASTNIGFNAPGTHPNTYTRLVLLDQTSKKEATSMFSSIEAVPACAISLGIASIVKSKEISLVAWGDNKARQIAKAVEGKITDAVPASILQQHSNAKVYLDLGAASLLTRINQPWLVTNCEWNNKLIRRAIVWLCEITGKPILKLTNKDYADNGLGELLATYGSAYNVNIKIFNDIQHTITGWPGGKPNADDSNRPERATPFPKKVIIFSPHPDDDVISMGGTFHKLVQQGHDVHVAYQTSGNIAVGDEEVVRYVSYLRNVCHHYGNDDSPILKRAEEIREFLLHDKVEGEPERPDVRFMKGTIRREEARTACRYVGVKEDHVHFLDLPFYETGTVKKNDLGEEDVMIVKDFIETIQPDQIFVAGDLADPHGTHKVCLDAILAAVDIFKDDQWFKNNCRIWMYRGAWAEWEIEHIEMAVPMSPEELRFKRNSILKHQSQMESAPFLGDDERLFWQRAEDRNRETAKLYSDLGLASYEAIEAFVQYHPLP